MLRGSRSVRILLGGVVILAILLGLAPAPSAAAAGQRWCPQQAAPYCAENAFLDYWQAVDRATDGYALDIIGFPVSPTLQMPSGLIIQFYERAIFEWHPENSVEYQVLLTRLGAFAIDTDRQLGLKGQAAKPPEPCPNTNECYLAKETNHTLRGTFLLYWLGNGALPVFGFPLTEQFQLRYTDGKAYNVQYFERNRFEAHPENTNPRYQVLLGRLGAEELANNFNAVKTWKVVATPNYGGTTTPPPPTPPAPPAQVSAAVSPSSGPGGTTFVARITGLPRGATVSSTIDAPNGTSNTKDFTLNPTDTALQVDITTFTNSPAGRYALTYRIGGQVVATAAFTITSPAAPPPNPPATSDQQLVSAAYNLIAGVPDARHITDNLVRNNVGWMFDPALPSGLYGQFNPAENRIRFNIMFRSMDPHDLGAVLAHEGQHAFDMPNGNVARTRADCYVLEYRGFLATATVWYAWYGPSGKIRPANSFEQSVNEDMLDILNNNGARVKARILEIYARQCSVYPNAKAADNPILVTLEGLPTTVRDIFPGAEQQLASITDWPELESAGTDVQTTTYTWPLD